jgi:hypothetical protein
MILVLLSFFLDIRVYIMRLCECAFMRIRVHTYTRLCVYACIRLRVYAYTRVCIYAFKRIYRRVAVDNGVEQLKRVLSVFTTSVFTTSVFTTSVYTGASPSTMASSSSNVPLDW